MLARMDDPTAEREATPPTDEAQMAEVRVPDRPAGGEGSTTSLMSAPQGAACS